MGAFNFVDCRITLVNGMTSYQTILRPEQHLYKKLQSRLHPDLASRFTVARMHSSLYRAKCANYPTIPKTLVYLGVLLGLPNLRPICKTLDGEDYIFQGVIGVVMNKTVSVVFASGRQIQFLQSRKNLHMDGTFKKRPRKPKCRQMYNIVTRFETCIIALVRVLMRSRSQEAYLTLFRFIKELAPNLQPRRIHCDFERATINALRVVFPGTSIVGCLWHFGVCIGIQANKKQLAPLAAKNDLVHSFIRCLSGAALLPPGLIVDGVEEIWRRVEAAGWSEQFEPFFQYFRREWYPRKYELSVFNHDERTNNCSESDNRSMATAIPQNHPNVWFLIGGFGQLEHITWSDEIAVQKGKAVQGPRRWKTIANDLRVSRLSRLLVKEGMSPGQFLEAASWVNEGALKHGLNIKPDDVTDSDSDSD
ncbi:hypothetical protein FOCC_FOCC012897 [Frankliniella occidentalis]|nr:hypothetical protein FOCC_FOCC012897 [Frankliniella occidentalis]